MADTGGMGDQLFEDETERGSGHATHGVDLEQLEAAIEATRRAALRIQRDSGHWCHELEADCTIPAEYVLMLHYFGEREPDVETGIGHYLRDHQGTDGGWPLYESGAMDTSCSVKAYFALKLIGDDPEAAHMQRACKAILARGGAARCNVFTRITLAMFGDLPWRGVPMVPAELVFLPRWFPVNLLKMSYWSRTVMAPLAVLCSFKVRAANPLSVHVRELFMTPPEKEKHYFDRPTSVLARLLLWLNRLARRIEPLLPRRLRRRALKRTEKWMLPHLNGEDGLGAIFPAMVNACEALDLMGYKHDESPLREARQSLRNLLVHRGKQVYCQPCVSPVWDTGLTCLAMLEDRRGARAQGVAESLDRALVWLQSKQLLQTRGDWALTHSRLEGGGWAFQYRNADYPDLDDTAVVTWAMLQSAHPEKYTESIQRAADWLVGMQSSNGGFAAFDADNNHDWLNLIPFADHGALLDPPTSDVSARVLTLLAQLDRPQDQQSRERVLDFLYQQQTDEGSWFGRWGTNYIYGTWSVLIAFAAAGIAAQDPTVRRAVAWLQACQRDDGSWGETNDTYFDPDLAGTDSRSNATQTAWAVLALMASGEGHGKAVARGIQWLIEHQCEDGRWHDAGFNAPGFPRVFYLKYHGYGHYFPYWALARYRRICREGEA